LVFFQIAVKIRAMQDFKITMPDFAGSPLQFIQEAREELKKVVWPTRKQVINLTVIVLVVSTGLAIFLGGLDLLFTKLLGFIV
jgi:preprotein translocase subunit SecE